MPSAFYSLKFMGVLYRKGHRSKGSNIPAIYQQVYSPLESEPWQLGLWTKQKQLLLICVAIGAK